MTLDEDLVKKVGAIANELQTTRSTSTRNALREAVQQYSIRRLEMMHRKGYAVHPVNKEEFSVWEKEQNWGDDLRLLFDIDFCAVIIFKQFQIFTLTFLLF